jgi:hypothetical protein
MEEIVSARDRTALAREGIVIVDAEVKDDRLIVEVTGAPDDRVRATVVDRLGAGTRVTVVDELPRRLYARPCVGQREREEGRLQLRYVLWPDEHFADVIVVEDDETVVVLGLVCVSAAYEEGEPCESPTHVYLDSPLGGRRVIDGFSGEEVPYKNVLASIQERIDREGWPLTEGGGEVEPAQLEERFAELFGGDGDERAASRPDGGG